MSATAVGERRVVVPLEPQSERIREQMRAYRREGAKLAAMILLAEPHRAGDEAIWDFLNRVQYIRRATVAEWLQAADIHPCSAVSEIKRSKLERLAAVLYRYSQESAA